MGSLYPSSKALGKALSHPISQDQRQQGKKILEVGSGIGGNVTEAIINTLRVNDHLDLVEIEPAYCEILEKKYGHLPNVSIHCLSLTNFSPGYSFDYIVSTLPHTLFPLALLQEIFASYVRLINDGGTVIYFHYFGWDLERPHERWIHKHILGNSLDAEEIPLKKALMLKFYREYAGRSVRIWFNIPPADVNYVTFGPRGTPTAPRKKI